MSITGRSAKRPGRLDIEQVNYGQALPYHFLTTRIGPRARTLCPAALKKDPGIPNLYPFKESLISQLEEKKQRAEQDQERRKLERQKEHAKKRSLQGLQNDVERRTKEFDKKVSPSPPPPPPPPSHRVVRMYLLTLYGL